MAFNNYPCNPWLKNEESNHIYLLMKLFLQTLLCLLAPCLAGGAEEKAQSALKLFVFDCGRLNYDSVEGFGITNEETQVRDLIVPCYVIEHEKGRLLWEGGLPSSLAEVDGWKEMGGGWRMRLDRTFKEQLADLDLGMDDFDFMAFSHFHFDHVGVANEVRGAKLIIQKPEYEAAFAEKVTVPGFDPPLYEKLREAEHIMIEGEHDVFGDGRVRLIPAPGHTPGHQVLFLDLEETGPIVLSGDLYHFRISRKMKRVPTFNVDAALSLQSIDFVEDFLKKTGAELWIEHDLARFEQLKKLPLFHR